KSDVQVAQQVREKKAYILYHHMNGELENLYQLFMASSLVEVDVLRGVRPEVIKKAIGEFLICCPVYRYYGSMFPLGEGEEKQVGLLLEEIQKKNPRLVKGVELLKSVFLQNPHRGDHEYNQLVSHFYLRCMQFSGPLMAKGVEDTLMYTYNRFIAHNEVGDDPAAFGISISEFHQRMTDRSEQWPLSINATSTHDTKRGEDVRARLQVLSALPDEWRSKVREWMQLNRPLKQNGVPDVNDEYFIYQSLIGTYPMPGEGEDAFFSRFKTYLQKAVREAKINSNWSSPNEGYENALGAFTEKLLNKETAFWKSFSAFHYKVSEHGILNSLAQLLLKFACPGVPDTYQGTELWDLSFVDPDNRRAVDYGKRIRWLEEIGKVEDQKRLFERLWQERFSGKIKLWMTHRLLGERNAEPDVFGYGDYIPLPVDGAYKEHVLAFARRLNGIAYVIAVPLHTAGLLEKERKTIFELDWKDTKIQLPFPPIDAHNVLGREAIKSDKTIPVKDLFKDFPFALCKCKVAAKKRGAGSLVHITSLPSPFGIGDLGPEARSFADFLYRTYQKYWQLLPLSPVEEGQGYSPYSSTSSKAGNILLVSPELLVEEGWLDERTLDDYRLPNHGKVDYAKAEMVKQELLDNAWKKFRQVGNDTQHRAFINFCEAESEWLDDFALYMVLKKLHRNRPWYEWQAGYKDRDEKVLHEITQTHPEEIRKIKWGQFVFFKQWGALKTYCNRRGIQLIGDLPFYISYDAADVWSHRAIFKLDRQGNRLAMAGVPPDAFSEDGQLWGMPVFNWDILKDQNYDWWVKRLQKNRELF
ncbi:MAG TPA: 4-alpha-glucanotransferase, partial [Flavisolibacter sp.]|nr:4-alpha-glucanotransferase [Flavisolibacter sp.]